jgi:sirohydrochlorin cobaltochelatase
MMRGLILFAHGSRDPRWADTIEALATRCRASEPRLAVRCAYLEFMQPDLKQAVEALRADNVTDLVIVPVFLAAGGHVLRDLPERVLALTHAYPELSLRIEPALGASDRVLQAMADVCLDSVRPED